MKNGLFLALALLCSTSVIAENRAKVEHMTVNLRLPDNSNLTVDMNFDCGSYYDKTAMIITSRQGAEILATAYEALYGPAAGKAVMDKWNKKAKAEDPRLPTFIVVKPPEGKSYLLNPANQKAAPFNMKTDLQEKTKNQSFNAAEISPSCGGVDHPDN